MFGGRAQRPVVVAKDGRKFGRRDGTHVGADFTQGLAVVPVRLNTMPVLASAGCSVSVTGRPECTPMPATDDFVAQRRLLCPNKFGRVLGCRHAHIRSSSFRTADRALRLSEYRKTRRPHSEFRLRPPKAAISQFCPLPLVHTAVIRGRFVTPTSRRRIQAKSSFAVKTLPASRRKANSRFFTNCYLGIAGFLPNSPVTPRNSVRLADPTANIPKPASGTALYRIKTIFSIT